MRKRLMGEEYRRFVRQVFEADGWRCKVCGMIAPLQCHHVVKRSHGGSDELKNCVSVCARCHENIERRVVDVIYFDGVSREMEVKRRWEV